MPTKSTWINPVEFWRCIAYRNDSKQKILTDILPDIDNLCFTFCIKMWDRGCLAVIQCTNHVYTVYLGKKLLQFVVTF